MTTAAADCAAEGRETLPGWGLFSAEHRALKRSHRLCACVVFGESLNVQSCEFINLTSLHRPSPVCILLRSRHVQSPLQGSVKLMLRSRSSMKTPKNAHPLSFFVSPCCCLTGGYVAGCSFIFFGKHCGDSHSVITSMQWECVVNSPSAKALISATSLNNLH